MKLRQKETAAPSAIAAQTQPQTVAASLQRGNGLCIGSAGMLVHTTAVDNVMGYDSLMQVGRCG